MNEIIAEATKLGLAVGIHAPDGIRRYRFSRGTGRVDYHSGHAIFTAVGKKEAVTFLQGFRAGLYTDKPKD